jgi:hypothetical protein
MADAKAMPDVRRLADEVARAMDLLRTLPLHDDDAAAPVPRRTTPRKLPRARAT